VQREIDVLRFLFAETVAAGRGARLSQEAALATEAQTYRGSDAVAAGLADEVTDIARGFDAFRQMAVAAPARRPVPALAPGRRETALSPSPRTTPRPKSNPRKETRMANDHDRNDTTQDAAAEADVRDVPQNAANADADAPDDAGADADDGAGPEGQRSVPATASPASSQQSAAAAPATATALAPPALPAPAADGANLADLSAQLRRVAAEITEIAAQAGRLGIRIDAAKALREGTSPEALRALVLERASEAADARDIVAAPPSPVLPQARETGTGLSCRAT